MITPMVPGAGPSAPTNVITQIGLDKIAKAKQNAANAKAAVAKKNAAAKAKKAAAAKKKSDAAKRKAPKKKLSALDKYLAGDTTYQQQLNEFNAEKSAYGTNYNRQNQVTNRDYNTTKRSANIQATQDRRDQGYDFAGRGILHSGVYATALGNYNTDFNTKMNNLLQGKNDNLANARGDFNDFNRQLGLQRNSAKQDAVRRRATKLGI